VGSLASARSPTGSIVPSKVFVYSARRIRVGSLNQNFDSS